MISWSGYTLDGERRYGDSKTEHGCKFSATRAGCHLLRTVEADALDSGFPRFYLKNKPAGKYTAWVEVLRSDYVAVIDECEWTREECDVGS